MAQRKYFEAVYEDGPLVYWPLQDNYVEDSMPGRNNLDTIPAGLKPGLLMEGMKSFSVELATNTTLGRNANLSTATTLSFECWVMHFAIPTGDTMFIANSGASSGVTVEMRSTGNFRANCPGVGTFANSTAVLSPLAWHHLVVQYTGSNWKYYIDGVVDNANAGTAAPIAASGGTMRFVSMFAVPSRYSNFAFYEYALTPGQIMAHYNNMFVADYRSAKQLVTSGAMEGATVYVAIQPSGVDVPSADSALIYVDIQVSSTVDVAQYSDAATVLVDIQPSSADIIAAVDSATVFMDIRNTGGECYSTFSADYFGEGEATLQWSGTANLQFSTDANLRWLADASLGDTVHC